ncbi:uncharacterized protein TNCV_1883711 [Trichonephila clavipes]|nr:uncharacterized protein TNCV_1883711 [Trichonephila clavipes]
MSQKSPFAIQKALIAIGGEPKSVKRLRSGDLLIETISALQTKSFLPAKTFLDSPVSVSPHKSLNSCRGVISEPDLLTIPDAEILEGFSDQAVIQPDTLIVRFAHTFRILCAALSARGSDIRGQLTCSRCASVGHSSTDCTLEPKFYLEARTLIVPQSSQTYAQAAKSSNKNSFTQTDDNIRKIKCPPLKLLQPLSSIPKSDTSITTPVISTSSSTQVELLPSTSSTKAIVSEPQPPIPVSSDTLSTTNNMFTPVGSSSVMSASSSGSGIQHPSESSTIPDFKKNAQTRARKRKKELLKKMNEAKIEIKMAQHRPRKPASVEYTTNEEDMIVYDMGEEIESPKNGSTLGETKRDIVKYMYITPTKYI